MGLAELGHIDQQRGVDELAEASDLCRVGQGLGEYHVRPGVQVGLRPLHGRVAALDGSGVGAGTYDKGRVASRLRRRLDAPAHVRDGHDLFAVQMAAALRVDLVLDVAAGNAQVLQDVHGAGGAQRLAETCVRVDERGQPRGAGDLVTARRHFAQGRQADVGQGQRRRHDGARDVHPFEAQALDQQRGEGVEGAREAQEPPRGQPGPQGQAFLGRRDRGVEHQNKPPFGVFVSRSGQAKVHSRTSSGVSAGSRSTRSKKRCCSSASIVPCAKRRNLST